MSQPYDEQLEGTEAAAEETPVEPAGDPAFSEHAEGAEVTEDDPVATESEGETEADTGRPVDAAVTEVLAG